ncbi:hypothetical protein [Paenibacillus graminis]|uniref:hypothetical protein n=1 Tax=Paenibacillus graminis TaxID=189425 RepID=UPI002DBE315C|nr:hypothetical protein [Paenibacillus graminis]MEC0169117.1 hypothetical protein [Paenibacillus graminis]
MLSVLHGNKILENKIIYIFNEFELLVDNKEKKVIEHLNDQTTVYRERKLYNLTDGLKNALSDRTLAYLDLIDIYNKIRNKAKFAFKTYFEILSNIRSMENINLSSTMIFTESLFKEINHLNRLVSNEKKGNYITSLNTFEKDLNIRQVSELLEDMTNKKTVVIVDNVLPEYVVKTIIGESERIYYIGSTEYYEINKQLFEVNGGRRKLELIEDYGIEDYFSEIIGYLEAVTTKEKINNILDKRDQSFLESVFDIKSSIPVEQLDNLLEQHVYLIGINMFPHLWVYSILLGKSNYIVDRLFYDFKSRYGMKLIQCLEHWKSDLNESNLQLMITCDIFKELEIKDEVEIDLFFTFLLENSQFKLVFDGKSFIKDILATFPIETLKNYFEIKVIEHIVSNYEPSLLSFSDLSEKVRHYCEAISSNNSITISERMPRQLVVVIEKYKQDYDEKHNIEWIHNEGYKNRNGILSPFTINFNKGYYFQGKINTYKPLRPIISKNIIFYIEKNKTNIFDLFSKKVTSYPLNSSKLSSINFASYDTNLILAENSEAYLINKDSNKINLQVKIDNHIYEGLRIEDQYVYFFPTSNVISRKPLKDFLKGESIFSGEELTFPAGEEINEEVIDLLINQEFAYWLCKSQIWQMDLITTNINKIPINDEEPQKLFVNGNSVFILFTNSIWSLNEEFKISWITDIPNWSKYTAYNDYLILISGSIIHVVSLKNGKSQIYQSPNKVAYSDIISTEDKVVIIDEVGNIYEGLLSYNELKNVTFNIVFLYKIEGNRGMISYSHRILSISCEKNIHVFGA